MSCVFGSDEGPMVLRKLIKKLDVMAWPYVSATGVVNLVFIKENMDKTISPRILKEHLL